jgi:hemolysin activation/secretion protein
MIPWKCRIGAMAAVALLLAMLPALAQVPPGELPVRERERFREPEAPGRERERFREPEAPRAQPGGTAITLPSTVAPAGAEKVMVTVRDVQVVGSTIYRPEEFTALYGDLVGHQITLAAVYEIAQRITARYGNDGYVLSRAIVPPQQLKPGGAFVRIEVIEGYIDSVVWPSVLSQYRDFFAYYTDKIISDRPTNVRTMERYLLLAGDLPGLKFKNSLKPSANKQGAATLVIEVAEKPIDALARFDNRGTKSRGPLEYLGSATFNNLLHMHEALTLTYAGTTQFKELHYYSAGYRQVLTPEGLTAFVNASISNGRPGLPVDPVLDYKTKSMFLESGLTYPAIRQRERNLAFTALAFFTDDRGAFLDLPNTPPSTHDRLHGVRLKADSDFADPLNGINQINVVVSHGIDGAGSTKNGSDLASRANGRVDFTKAELTLSRAQPLPYNFSVVGALYAQHAFTPLLASELCGYGGRYFGRAFDPSTLVGDSCLELLGEVRYDIPFGIKDLTQAQLYAFADRGWLHNIAPDDPTLKNVDAASVGGGARLGWQSFYSADLSVAKAIAGPRDDWRFFFILTGRY